MATETDRARNAPDGGEVAGWKMVPIEPTEEMWKAGANAGNVQSSDLTSIYRTMLSAAPPAPTASPASGVGVALERSNGKGGWTIAPSVLEEIQKDAGEWAKESYLETVEAIALATEQRIRSALVASPEQAFQSRVQPWMMACFGPEISADRVERNHRFLEEALELVQSTGCTQSEAHQLVDYVYGRPVGETHQEIGGVMVTLAALCLAIGEDMHAAAETELARIWTKVEKIRAKHAAKPKHSPLPEHVASPEQGEVVRELLAKALDVLDNYADPSGYTDNDGELLPADTPDPHPGVLARDTAAEIRTTLAKIGGQAR